MPEYRLTKHQGKLALTWDDAEGKRRRRTTGTANPGLAEAQARKMWAVLSKAPSDRVDDLWKSYIRDRKADNKDTTRQDQIWGSHLYSAFGHKLGTEVNKDQCRTYAQARRRQGASASTVNTELSYLRACLNLRYGRGNTHVWIPSPSAPRDHYLTKDQVEILHKATNTPHIKLFITLAIGTGARMSSILDLRWDQVDLKHRTINFNVAEREQSNKRRPEIRMSDKVYEALLAASSAALTDYVIEYMGRNVGSVKRAIRNLSDTAGIPASPHVFRHTAGVWMANADVPMEKISQFLGHTTTRVTERVYARFSPSFMKDATDALDW